MGSWPNINRVDAVSMLSMEWWEPGGRKTGFGKSPDTSVVEGTPVEGRPGRRLCV